MSDLSFLIVVLLVVALALQVDFIFYIAYVMLGIYAWSVWIVPRAFRQIRFERHFTDHAFLGERVQVTIRLNNQGRLPLPWLQVEESVPPELASGLIRYALSLGSKGSTSFTYQLQTTRRGYYRLGPLYIRMGDLFGWKEESFQSDFGYLTVYPRIIPLSRLGLSSRLPFGTIASQQRLFEDPARPVGVRDYRSGDSLRQINWKVSAHSNNLLVRTLEPAISLDTALLLNLNSGDYSRHYRYSAPEWAIEVAASIATHLVNHKQTVGLMTNGSDPLLGLISTDETAFDQNSGRLRLGNLPTHKETLIPSPIPPRGGRPHLMKLLELLARVEPAEGLPFVPWVPRACLHLSWGATIPVITPLADQATCQALHRLVRAGFNPVLLLIVPTPHLGQVQQRARRLGFAAHQIVDRRELDSWQQPQVRGAFR